MAAAFKVLLTQSKTNKFIRSTKPLKLDKYLPWSTLSWMNKQAIDFDTFNDAAKQSQLPSLLRNLYRVVEQRQEVEYVKVSEDGHVTSYDDDAITVDIKPEDLQKNGFYRHESNVFSRTLQYRIVTFPRYCVTRSRTQLIDIESGDVLQVLSSGQTSVKITIPRNSLTLLHWLNALITQVNEQPLQTWYWANRISHIVLLGIQ